MEGWIKLHRKILSWEWFKNENTFKVFMYLLLSANHKDKKWKGVDVKRGQIITGRISIAENTGITERSVRTCLKHLKSTGEVTVKVTNKYSIITICKYEEYQIRENTNDQQYDQQEVTQTTSKRPASDHNQEYKEEIREGKEVKISLADFKKTEEQDEIFIKKLMSGEFE